MPLTLEDYLIKSARGSRANANSHGVEGKSWWDDPEALNNALLEFLTVYNKAV